MHAHRARPRRHAAPATLLALGLTLALSQLALAQQPAPSAPDWSAVDQALGRKGSAQPGGVMRYSFPRSDLQVTVEDVRIAPALALGSWVAFERLDTRTAMAMGDLVLTSDEITPALDALQRAGIEQTALHHHLLGASPRVLYMHIMARGDPATIARGVREALATSKTPLGTPAPPSQEAIALDTAAIARALGHSGKVTGGVYQVSIPRMDRITEGGHTIPPAMGVATAINFQPTGPGRAAVTGDFVLIGAEVNPAIRALRASRITVTSLHNHMLDESPRLFFMHFWANDDALTLARGLRSALDRTRSRPPAT